MRDDHSESSFSAHSIGAVLAGALSLFARSADDVARMGVNCLDDVGRACVTTSDDIGSLMSRSGDDLFRQIDEFRVPHYADEPRFEVSPPGVVARESDEAISVGPHVAKQVAEAAIKIVDRNDGEDN